MTDKLKTIFVGYDIREIDAYNVLKFTAKKYSSEPLNIIPINQDVLRRIGLYRRAWLLGSSHKPSADLDNDVQHVDLFDRKPFSTDFSFTRFLVPFLNFLDGWALYMDCDMYFRSDPIQLFNQYNDPKKAAYVVKHNYKPNDKVKMYGTKQVNYSRKNWSSLVIYNCSHPSHNNLTVDDISIKPGKWLHNFRWLNDNEIGSIHPEWNWLEGYSSNNINPKVVHFTRGGPWFKKLTFKIDKTGKRYFDEWSKHLANQKKLNL
jgi:hypothetical protein